MSAISDVKFAFKLTGTSAQAEEFSVFFFPFFLQHNLIYTFDWSMYSLILHKKAEV